MHFVVGIMNFCHCWANHCVIGPWCKLHFTEKGLSWSTYHNFSWFPGESFLFKILYRVVCTNTTGKSDQVNIAFCQQIPSTLNSSPRPFPSILTCMNNWKALFAFILVNKFGLSLSSSSSSEIIYSQGTETLSNIKISSLAELLRARDKNSLYEASIRVYYSSWGF